MFTYDFMQNAVIAGMIVGLISPLVGVYLVMKRLSLIADALSHVSLSGVAAGLLLKSKVLWLQGINPLYIGMLFSIVGSLFVERLRRLYHRMQELTIPIMMSGGIALGVVLISSAEGFNVDVAGYLFGNILAVSDQELLMTLGVGLLVVGFIFLFHRPLFATSYDEEHAALAGVPRYWLNFGFFVIVALVIAVAIRVVGILLISALMTLPVAISLQLAQSFRQLLLYAILFAQLAVWVGLVSAYYLEWASGGAIVLVMLAMLLCIVIGKGLRKIHSRNVSK
jgi:zinc transport system permease protein